ncbi:glycosyltransferase family 4 protein [Acidipila rosea]|uniref:Glycosyltransferase involved in cell wall biosynthesis n=1 Tax=Acidipila rosea TaxID=768535 RepID=A0A4R1L6Y0_9BACT|nr:glycosyltransferase family 4 protein [Acidipila rosea]TCK72049.1 glycosyltransferase involved in cell wall biosynthesis [Acidipila rosea]
MKTLENSETPMRILHILNDVTVLGNGIVNTAVDLAIEQARQGHVVAIASAGGGYEPLLEELGVSHFKLDQSRSVPNMMRALLLFRRHLRQFRPDVVHAHMRTGLLLAWGWSLVYRFPLIAHLHNVRERESTLMGLADRVIAVSHSVAATMSTKGIQRKKLRVALNRTLGTPRLPRMESVRPAVIARPSIVTVAGMYHNKGIAELISAFEIAAERCTGAQLYLVGDGPDRRVFEEQARSSKWSKQIHFEGFQAIPQAYMMSADVFVLASRRESFGLVLIEAREAGCAIIASRTDGTAEALDEGRAGLLVPPENVPALADALCRLLGDDHERRMWQQRAMQGVEAFRVEVMAAEVLAVYCELVRPDAIVKVALPDREASAISTQSE